MLDLAFRLKRIDRINYVTQLNAPPEVLEAVATSSTYSATTTAGTGAVLMESAAAAEAMSATQTSGEDSDTTAWANAVIAAGGSVSTPRRTHMNTYIAGLKVDTVWPVFDRLWVHAAENGQSAAIDLVTRAVISSFSGPVTCFIDQGYENYGPGGYTDLNYNLQNDSDNLTANSSHIMTWNLSNLANNSQSITDLPGTNIGIYPKYATDNNIYGRVMDVSAGIAMTDPRGMLLANRSSSVARQMYQNGVVIGDTAFYGTQSTQGLHNSPMILYYWWIAVTSLGGSLDATQQLAFFTRTRTLMLAIARKVHYTFDSLTVTDATGYGNTGTIGGSGTTLVAGHIGNALSFNGSGYVTFSDVSKFSFAAYYAEITICAWIKTSAVDGVIVCLRNLTDGNPLIEFTVGQNGASNSGTGKLSALIRDNINVSPYAIVSTGTVNNNAWRHVTFTRDKNGSMSLYVDGASAATPVTDGVGYPTTFNETGSFIGKDLINPSLPTFIGSIDDLQIFNRALAPFEVAYLASL